MAHAGFRALLLLVASTAAKGMFGFGRKAPAPAPAPAPTIATKGSASGSVKMPLTKITQVGKDIYTVAVDVGTPAKTLNLMVDTKSPISWVDYRKTPALANSTTAVNEGAELEYTSDMGQAAGVGFKDKFCVKGGSTLCVKKQPYILCDQVASFPKKDTFNGLLGLGAPNALTQEIEGLRLPGASFTQEANASKSPSTFAFGMSLAPSNSFVSFGEVKDVMADAPQGLGAGVTVPVTRFADEPLLWNVPMSMAIGKNEKMAVKDLKVQLNSGSSVITAPASADQYLSSVIQMLQYQDTNEAVGKMILTLQREANSYQSMYGALVQQLSSSQCETDQDQIICYCNTTLQPLTFIVEGEGGKKAEITLTSEDLLTQVAKAKSGDPVCQVNIQQGREGFWSMGTAFLKKAYVVHDVTSGKVTLFPTTASAASLAEQEQDPVLPPGLSMRSILGSTLVGVLMGSMAAFTLLRFARAEDSTSTRSAPLMSA